MKRMADEPKNPVQAAAEHAKAIEFARKEQIAEAVGESEQRMIKVFTESLKGALAPNVDSKAVLETAKKEAKIMIEDSAVVASQQLEKARVSAIELISKSSNGSNLDVKLLGKDIASINEKMTKFDARFDKIDLKLESDYMTTATAEAKFKALDDRVSVPIKIMWAVGGAVGFTILASVLSLIIKTHV